MKANELRIGNWLTYNGAYDYPVGINEINFIKENPNNSDFKPTPINEQILLDFGFIKGERYFKAKEYGEEGIFTTMCYDLESKDFIVNSNDYDSYIIECMYVHQLQNLFFALTGEELIKK